MRSFGQSAWRDNRGHAYVEGPYEKQRAVPLCACKTTLRAPTRIGSSLHGELVRNCGQEHVESSTKIGSLLHGELCGTVDKSTLRAPTRIGSLLHDKSIRSFRQSAEYENRGQEYVESPYEKHHAISDQRHSAQAFNFIEHDSQQHRFIVGLRI